MTDGKVKDEGAKEGLWRSDESLHAALVRLARENRSLTFFTAFLFIPLLATAIYYSSIFFLAPKHVSVGIVVGSPDAKVMEAVRDVLPKTKERLRIEIKTFESAKGITAALEAGSLDMGILRSDLPFPTNARSVINLREISVAIAALSTAETKDISALGGKNILVVSAMSDAQEFTASVLRNAGVKEARTGGAKSPEEAAALLKAGKAAAIAIVDSPDRGYTRRIWRGIASGGKIELLPIVEVAELAAANPGFTEDKIAAKAISTKPATPEEEVTVLKSGYLLIARATLDRSYVAALAGTMYARRIEIARTAPSINAIKTIDNEYVTSSLIPVHDGALDYYRREQMSFYDRYNDIIWLFIFYGGSLFSGIAWLGQSMFRTQREHERNILRDMNGLLSRVREAASPQDIEAIARDTEKLVGDCLAMTHRGQLGQKRLTAISLGYDAIKSALQRRRYEFSNARPAQTHGASAQAGGS